MRDGVIAETPADKLQNKLRGVGSLMLREQFPLKTRLRAARTIYDMLAYPEFEEMRRNLVFAAFFTKGELSDRDAVALTRVRDA